MSIFFGEIATSDRIDFGSAASLDNLTGSDFTFIAWTYRKGFGDNQHVISKDIVSPYGPTLLFDGYTTPGKPEPRMFVGSTTLISDAVAVDGTSKPYRWECVAGTFSNSLRLTNLIFGTETQKMRQPAYAVQSQSYGTLPDDSTGSLYVGNLPRSAAYPFYGGIAWVGVYPRILTLAEAETWRLQTLAGMYPKVYGARLIARLDNPGRIADLSGNNNFGTRTGSRYSLLRPKIYSRRIWVPVTTGTNTYTITPSGVVAFSGASALLRTRAFVPSGSVAFSGTAAQRRTRAIIPIGQITFSGAAPITFTQPNIYTIVPTGSIAFSGTAPNIRTRVTVPTGQITFSGTAPQIRTRIQSPSGQVFFSGTAPMIFIPAGGLASSDVNRISIGVSRSVGMS